MLQLMKQKSLHVFNLSAEDECIFLTRVTTVHYNIFSTTTIAIIKNKTR